MAMEAPNKLTGLDKACILLVALGTAVSADVFKVLTEPEIELLSAEIMKMHAVEPAVKEAVLAEFEQNYASKGSTSTSGKDFAAQVLEQVVGQEKANELLAKAAKPGRTRAFGSLWELDAGQIAQMLGQEHPQIIALVLTHLPPEKAAMVLSDLGEAAQAEVAHRICLMDQIEPDVLGTIEEALQTKMASTTTGPEVTASGGPNTLVEILNYAERSTERNVLETLMNQDPAVGEEVRGMMFVFEDLPKLEGRSVQLVLREVDQEDLRVAVKGSADEIKEIIFKNMSERAAEMLKEDLELVGSVREKDVEAAQQKIVRVVRRLLASGEVALATGEEEQVVEQDDQVAAAA